MTADSLQDRVLVHAPVGRDGPTIVHLLGRAGVTAVLSRDLDTLVAELRIGAAAIFIAEEGLFGRDFSALTKWVDEQPPWSDFPFVVLTSRHDLPTVTVWRENLVNALRNVSLLERPVQSITLTSSMQTAIRARGRQYQIRDLLEARERAARELEGMVAERTAELVKANEQLTLQMEERARVEEALRQSQKMEALGQLTGGIAHDFNNLLMVVLGGLDLLDRDPKRRQMLIESMRHAARRGAGLTRQLLAFSRRQPLKPEPIHLTRQIGAMRELLEGSLGAEISIRFELPDELWPVELDPAELELSVLNLAVNARDAMPGGGTLTIKGENVVVKDGVDLVRLSVTDTGSGIAPEVKNRVFEPFFTTKDVGKGSGLGLAQVYGFAEQSHGKVTIDTELGRGTSIILDFPRSDAMPRSSPVPDSSLQTAAAPATSGNVLLVDDDDDVGALVEDMLRQIGYAVTRVSSAAAALGALANGRPIDLVLSDVMMPGGMDGIGLAREIRRRRRGLPILLTSGYAEAVMPAAAADGIALLPKPYALADLASAVDAALMTTKAAPRQPPKSSSQPAL